MNRRSIAEEIFIAGVKSVIPSVLVKKHLRLEGDILIAGDIHFNIAGPGNIYVAGAGKASGMMAAEVENILGDHIFAGHVVVKYGFACDLQHVKITEAGHPAPDENSFRATGEIMSMIARAGEDDLIICLISGGGSSLLSDTPEGIGADDLIRLNDNLVNSGASISEINTVRKHLSDVKGGQLARTAYPATTLSLIISDVPGDRTDVIASGPTVPDPTTYEQAIDVIRKFGLLSRVPPSVVKYLESGIAGRIPETPKPGDPLFTRTCNIVIGNNKTALMAACEKAEQLNLYPVIMDAELQGNVTAAAEYITGESIRFQADAGKTKPACLLFGGETTLKMTGNGKGGRNQHLALACSLLLENAPGITILAAGTDGNDGPTNAAGAVVDSGTVAYACSQDLDPGKYLEEFDSWSFFTRAGGHVITGPTMTNVMDIIVSIVE